MINKLVSTLRTSRINISHQSLSIKWRKKMRQNVIIVRVYVHVQKNYLRQSIWRTISYLYFIHFSNIFLILLNSFANWMWRWVPHYFFSLVLFILSIHTNCNNKHFTIFKESYRFYNFGFYETSIVFQPIHFTFGYCSSFNSDDIELHNIIIVSKS